MLIVNADDLGASPRVTRRILEAFDEGLITSTSAMTWMHGSDAAAEQARERRLPVGLHLNLTLPFDADDVPARVRDRQRALEGVLGPDSWRADADLGAHAELVAAAVRDQLDRFREEIGEPDHVDGHHHVHVQPAVLDALPPELPVRSLLRMPPHAADPPGARERALHARFAAPDLVLALEHVHPDLGGSGLDPLWRAHVEVVEVVVHPGQARDLEALRAPAWRAALADLPLGTYADLRDRGR